MHILDAKMEAWRKVYAQLKDARIRYKAALAASDPAVPVLLAEVDLLQHRCGVALDEMQAELARVRDGGDSKGDSR